MDGGAPVRIRAAPPPCPRAEGDGRDPQLPTHLCAGQGGAGLELVVVALHGVLRRGLWAGSRRHQLHEVLAAAGLRGAGHHRLLPAQQAYLGWAGGAQAGSVGLGPHSTAPSPRALTVVERLGPCQQPVPCSYFMALNLSWSGPAHEPQVLWESRVLRGAGREGTGGGG